VIHPGQSDKVEVTLTRENIHVDTVLGDRRKGDDSWDFMLQPQQHIGYVRLTAFSRDTARELRKVLEQLRSDGMRGLILDLRFDPGGLLSAAIEVSDLFVSDGRIVSTKGRNTPERVWEAHKEGTFEGFPMVVLVNRYSASASEIVAACLQDHKRAVIMGERSWGKGSVQNVIELEGGKSLLKLTTASYRRPSGKDIHRFFDNKDQKQWGVTPDEGFELKLSDAEMHKLFLDRRQRDVVRPNHHQTEEAASTDKAPAENADGALEKPQPEEAPQQPAGETPKGETPKGETPKDETPKGETPKGETPKDETPKDETPKDKEQDAQPKPGAAEQPETPAFVDHQLQMAVDYLTKELAKAQ
jgi:carboxyl-terminal processing protease